MILLQFDPPEPKGDSIVEKHTDWIAIDSLQFGVGRGIGSSSGGVDRETSNPSFSEIVITKQMDVASTQLMLEAATGKSINKATFHFIQTGGKDAAGQHYLEIILDKPLLSGWSMSSGGDRPSESISINYNRITIQYNQFKDGGTVIEGKPKSYNLMVNKAV
jgi:type VI secretion system secreted protein Hcp